MWQRLPLMVRDGLFAVLAICGLAAPSLGSILAQGAADRILSTFVLGGFVGALALRRRFPLPSAIAVAVVGLGSAVATGGTWAYIGLSVVALSGISVSYYHRRAWSFPLLACLAGAWFISFTLLLGEPLYASDLTLGIVLASLPIFGGYMLRRWAERGHMFGVMDEALLRWRRAPVLLRDGCGAACLAWLTWALSPLHPETPLIALLYFVSLAALATPLAFRRRYPLGSGLTLAGVALILAALDAPGAWSGLWMTTMAGASTAYHHRERWSLAFLLPAAMVWLLSFVALVGPTGIDVVTLVLLPLTATVPILIGYALRLNAERQEQTARLQWARVLQERSEERTRIARDVHDIVGHYLSAIRLQALGGRNALKGDLAGAEAALATVADLSGQALGEIRSLLRRLQDEDGEGHGKQEQHRLADLSDLARNLHDVGLRVRLDLKTAPEHRIAAETHTAAYRIVQEALTNVLRHSISATAQVRVILEGSTLSVQVNDPGPPARQGDTSSHGGHGLVGMRERAAEVGGELSAGSHGNEGWQVRARLPARQADTPSIEHNAAEGDGAEQVLAAAPPRHWGRETSS